MPSARAAIAYPSPPDRVNLTLKQYDVAIVGAGPAGSVAAQRLAAAGIQVILFEKDTFPRDKSCGDGVTSEGLQVLERCGLGAWAADFPIMPSLRLSSPGGLILDVPFAQEGDGIVGRLIPRRLMDALLAQKAVDAGAELRQSCMVKDVQINLSNGVQLHTSSESVLARMLILAEGSAGTLARRLNLTRDRPELSAVRQYLTGDTSPQDRLEIHFQANILPGYNWIFPMGGGRVNIGSGTYTNRVTRGEINLQRELQRFTQDPITEGRLLRCEPAGVIRGHPLRTQIMNQRTHCERTLAVGDSAGLVGPFSGVGIAPALRSGEMAAEHALRALQRNDFSEKGWMSTAGSCAPITNPMLARRALCAACSTNPAVWTLSFAACKKIEELALVLGHILLHKRSPRQALHLSMLLRLL